MQRHLSALFLIFAAVSASVAPTTWTEVRSPHFIVLTNSGERDGRHVAGQFERMRSVFHKLLPGADSDNDPPITVLALKDRKSLQSIEPESYLAKGSLDLAGMFLRTPDKNYILLRLDTQGEHPYSTVYHEYTHFLLRKSDSYLPLWLNEGLAQFYENTEIQDKEVMLGQPNANEIFYLRHERLLPLATLFAVDHNSPYYHQEQKGSAFYAESWALTHYLIVSDRQNKTERLATYNRLLQQHEDPVTAAEHAFGDLKKMEQELDHYIHGDNYMQFRMNSGFALDDSALAARPISNSVADATRADVLVATKRTKEAEALLETILRDDPNDPTAHEVMGNQRLRMGDRDGARKWYGEAVQLGTQNYMTNFQYANLSLQTGNRDHDAAIESSLRTAIKLNPTFAPAYDTLAIFYLSRNRNLDEAHTLNLMAVQYDPANMHYRMNAASVLEQNHQPENALNVLKTALKVARGKNDKAMLQSRIDSIEHRQSGEALTGAVDEHPGPVIAAESDHITVSPASGQSEAEQRNAERIQNLHTTLAANHTAHTAVELSADGKTATVDLEADPEPAYPAEAATGPHHTVKGVLRSVKCSYPTVLSLSLEQPAGALALYTNNYFRVPFTAVEASPKAIDACKGIEGRNATVTYAEIADKSLTGQILSVELTK